MWSVLTMPEFEPNGAEYLNKHFEAPPYSQAVEVGGSVELRCHPPLGVPPPTVYWLKNSAPLETDTNLIVSSEGHLLVGQARLEDTANYTCVAENVAAHRLSEAARLVVYVVGFIKYQSGLALEPREPGSTTMQSDRPVGKPISTSFCYSLLYILYVLHSRSTFNITFVIVYPWHHTRNNLDFLEIGVQIPDGLLWVIHHIGSCYLGVRCADSLTASGP
uniref:Ig-like domain-containing protein n=1 Tax=Timema douglasi TaxID=61478 RepID=A0A7R8VL14_TIMDO|nr:unnamed protein product [Timema douglasi]